MADEIDVLQGFGDRNDDRSSATVIPDRELTGAVPERLVGFVPLDPSVIASS